MKAQPSLVTMVSSISVNSVFFEVLRPKSGCLSERKRFFSISVLNSANLASSGIQAQHHQAQDESTEIKSGVNRPRNGRDTGNSIQRLKIEKHG